MITDLVVGFDLDLTLIDSAPGVGAAWRALSAETGVPVDVDAVVKALGPPIEDMLADWFPAERVPALADRFRAIYPAVAIEPTLPLPGARAALEAVHAAGGRTLVVTGKHEPNAGLHLTHLKLPVDDLVGGVWSTAKGAVLAAHGARVYVGDHVGDMRGAVAGHAFGVGVLTGSTPADELRAAGAGAVLPDLTSFPDWLIQWLRTLDQSRYVVAD
jgi:phosphoglycolate phosphatase